MVVRVVDRERAEWFEEEKMLASPPPDAELSPPVLVPVVPAFECPSDTTPSE